jgi:SAM-dependent methyltransferase
MEELDNLREDYALADSLRNLQQIVTVLPRIQDKLKILEAALAQISVGDFDQGEVPEVSYGYIPLDLGDFFDCLFDLETALIADSDFRDADLAHRRVDFVEVGCGSGRNVFLAGATDRFEFGKVHGFDLSKPLIEYGQRIFGMGKDLFVADCMEFDFSPYDVVYFYRPFSDEEAQLAFEDMLIGNLKPGAYVIGYGNLAFADDRRLLSKCEYGHLFKKLR